VFGIARGQSVDKRTAPCTRVLLFLQKEDFSAKGGLLCKRRTAILEDGLI
jgi:hypothetical protein